jgi:hypothetical protein
MRWVLPLYSAAMNEGVVHGLRQALVMLALSAVAVLVGAGLWAAVEDSAFRPKAGIVSMIIAALIGLTGGTALSRATTNDVHAFLGMGPDREDPMPGRASPASACSCSSPCRCSSQVPLCTARAERVRPAASSCWACAEIPCLRARIYVTW